MSRAGRTFAFVSSPCNQPWECSARENKARIQPIVETNTNIYQHDVYRAINLIGLIEFAIEGRKQTRKRAEVIGASTIYGGSVVRGFRQTKSHELSLSRARVRACELSARHASRDFTLIRRPDWRANSFRAMVMTKTTTWQCYMYVFDPWQVLQFKFNNLNSKYIKVTQNPLFYDYDNNYTDPVAYCVVPAVELKVTKWEWNQNKCEKLWLPNASRTSGKSLCVRKRNFLTTATFELSQLSQSAEHRPTGRVALFHRDIQRLLLRACKHSSSSWHLPCSSSFSRSSRLASYTPSSPLVLRLVWTLH